MSNIPKNPFYISFLSWLRGHVIEVATLAVAIINLCIAVYVVQLEYNNQVELERFRRQFNAARLEFEYTPSSGDFVVYNSGEVVANGVEISVRAGSDIIWEKLEAGVLNVDKFEEYRTTDKSKIFVFTLSKIAAGKDFAVRFSQQNTSVHPNFEELGIQIFCDNCLGPATNR